MFEELVMPEVILYGEYRITWEPMAHNSQVTVVALFYGYHGKPWTPVSSIVLAGDECCDDYWVRLRKHLDGFPNPEPGNLPYFPSVCPF